MRIPSTAKRVLTAKQFEVRERVQPLFDGSAAIFHRVKQQDAVQIIPVVGEKILLCEEIQPHWTAAKIGFFGGWVENGEEPLQAAQRELLEETWLNAREWCYMSSYNPINIVDWDLHFFVAKDCFKACEAAPEIGEKIRIREVTFDEFIEFLADKYKHKFTMMPFDPVINPQKAEQLRKILFE